LKVNNFRKGTVMDIFALQGDQVIRQLSQPIAGQLAPAKLLVIAGSHSAPHTIRGTVYTRMEGDLRLVRVKKATVIEHTGRHRPTMLPKGDYSIGTQRERGGDGDRAVED
jgi:hypothetical protein